MTPLLYAAWYLRWSNQCNFCGNMDYRVVKFGNHGQTGAVVCQWCVDNIITDHAKLFDIEETE